MKMMLSMPARFEAGEHREGDPEVGVEQEFHGGAGDGLKDEDAGL
jgi:hypothetical protein